MTTGQWYNDDGLQVRYGEYHSKEDNQTNVFQGVKDFGAFKQIVMDYDLTLLATNEVTFTTDRNNDDTKDGFNDGDVFIPAGAIVKSVEVISKVAADSAGDALVMLIGTYQQDGTVIDADGFCDASAGAQAQLAANTLITVAGSDGADIGTTPSASLNAYPAIQVTGAGGTAGRGQIVITYTDLV